MKGKFGQLCFIPKIWKPTPNVQCHWKDGKHQESHLYSDIKISLPKHTSSPEVFIKCRNEVLVLLGLSFTPEAFFSPIQTLPRGSAAQFITSQAGSSLCSQHHADPNTRFSWKPRLSEPAQSTLSFASFLTIFIAFQSWRLPGFISLFFLLTVCHKALSSCLDHPLTCLGCADLSSSHK